MEFVLHMYCRRAACPILFCHGMIKQYFDDPDSPPNVESSQVKIIEHNHPFVPYKLLPLIQRVIQDDQTTL